MRQFTALNLRKLSILRILTILSILTMTCPSRYSRHSCEENSLLSSKRLQPIQTPRKTRISSSSALWPSSPPASLTSSESMPTAQSIRTYSYSSPPRPPPAKAVSHSADISSNPSTTASAKSTRPKSSNINTNLRNTMPPARRKSIWRSPKNLRCVCSSSLPTPQPQQYIKSSMTTAAQALCSRLRATLSPTHSAPTTATTPPASARHSTTRPYPTSDARIENT